MKVKSLDFLYDYDSRDFPSILLNGELYIGNRNSTHYTLIQEMFYNMNFSQEYGDLYFNLWNEEGDSQGIGFYRKDIEEELEGESFLFGHVVGDVIYWDYNDSYDIQDFKIHLRKYKNYKHFIVFNGNNCCKVKDFGKQLLNRSE